MKNNNIDEWINWAKQNCRNIVFYQQCVFDLTKFISSHPGGIMAIRNYIYKDITNILFQVFPHNKKQTLKMLSTYKIGTIPIVQGKLAKPRHKKSSTDYSKPKQIKKVCFQQDKFSAKQKQNHDKLSISMKRSHKNNDNIKSIVVNKMTKSQRPNPKSKSKSQKIQYLTSIKVLQSDLNKSYDEYYQECKLKLAQKQKMKNTKSKNQFQKRSQCSFTNNQLDQKKPNFVVPVLSIKTMFRNFN